MHHLRSGGDDGTVRRISVCYVSNIMPRWDPSMDTYVGNTYKHILAFII